MKEETTIEQILQDVARQEGAKIVKVNQVAGIHVFSSDMEKPPTVLIDGNVLDVITIFAYATDVLVDEMAKQGINCAEAEEIIVEAIQYTFALAKVKAISLTPEAAATEQDNTRLRKQTRKENRTMAKMNLKFRDFLTLLSPAQHITVQDEDNPLKQGESDILFEGKAAKARREEELADREVKMIAPTGEPDLPGTYIFKIWLYR